MARYEIQTAPETEELVALADVKSHLGVTSSGDDAALQRFINAAVEFMKEYTGRSFARTEVKEYIRGFGTSQLMLSSTPIKSVTCVTVDGEAVTDYDIRDKDAGFLYRSQGWDWTAGITWYYQPRRYAGSEDAEFEVTYWGGYWLNTFTGSKPSDAIAVPASLEMIFLDLVKFWYTSHKNNLQGVDSISIGDYSVRTANNKSIPGVTSSTSVGVPPDIVSRLNKWVRIV